MRDGISLRMAVLGGATLLAAAAVATVLYFRSLEGAMLADAPLAVAEVPADPAALAGLTAGLAEARAGGREAILDEEAANRAIFAEWLTDAARDARLTFDAPFARLKLAERVGERWLNAELVLEPYAAPPDPALEGDRGGLAFRVLAGRVGDVSISATAGEWARGRIERRLALDLRANPRTAGLFAELADARVTAEGLVLRYRGVGGK